MNARLHRERRYVFNVGEGFQRFCMEHGVSLRKLSRVFFTRVCGETTGGLTGMLLTMADGATEHHENEPEIHVHGPPRVERLMGEADDEQRAAAFLSWTRAASFFYFVSSLSQRDVRCGGR